MNHAARVAPYAGNTTPLFCACHQIVPQKTPTADHPRRRGTPHHCGWCCSVETSSLRYSIVCAPAALARFLCHAPAARPLSAHPLCGGGGARPLRRATAAPRLPFASSFLAQGARPPSAVPSAPLPSFSPRQGSRVPPALPLRGASPPAFTPAAGGFRLPPQGGLRSGGAYHAPRGLCAPPAASRLQQKYTKPLEICTVSSTI